MGGHDLHGWGHRGGHVHNLWINTYGNPEARESLNLVEAEPVKPTIWILSICKAGPWWEMNQ